MYQAILQGELLPNERLVEMELAQRYNASRGAVRIALARLEHERLVEREPNRGARVRRVSEQEAVEIMEARAALETLAVRAAAVRATERDLADLWAIIGEMEACLASGDLPGISQRNGVLHQRLLEIASNRTISRLIEQLHAQQVRTQFRIILAPGRPPHTVAEHRAIVAAVAAHDPDAAEAAMRTHLAHSLEALRQMARSRRLD